MLMYLKLRSTGREQTQQRHNNNAMIRRGCYSASGSEREDVVARARVGVKPPHRFGARRSGRATSVRTLVTLSLAGATVAAESHRVGEDGAGVEGTARQDGRAVLHLLVGAASLDEEAGA